MKHIYEGGKWRVEGDDPCPTCDDADPQCPRKLNPIAFKSGTRWCVLAEDYNKLKAVAKANYDGYKEAEENLAAVSKQLDMAYEEIEGLQDKLEGQTVSVSESHDSRPSCQGCGGPGVRCSSGLRTCSTCFVNRFSNEAKTRRGEDLHVGPTHDDSLIKSFLIFCVAAIVVGILISMSGCASADSHDDSHVSCWYCGMEGVKYEPCYAAAGGCKAGKCIDCYKGHDLCCCLHDDNPDHCKCKSDDPSVLPCHGL